MPLRIGRRRPTVDQPPIIGIPAVAAQIRRTQRDHYALGLEDGVKSTLDHLEGKNAGGVPYTGPIPDELRAYIARIRTAITTEEAHRG